MTDTSFQAMLDEAEAQRQADQRRALELRAQAAQVQPQPAEAPVATTATKPAETPKRSPSLLERAGSAIRTGLNVQRTVNNASAEGSLSVGAGIVRAPGVLVGSVIDFGQDTDEFIGEIASSALTRVGLGGVAKFAQESQDNKAAVGATFRRAIGQDSKATWSDMLSARETLGRVGNDTINQATAVIAASAAPALVTGGASLAPTFTGSALRIAAVGAFGGGVVNSPDDERLSNGLQQLGLHTAFTDWLAQDDADGAMESRFKGAVEGVLIEGAAEAVFHAAKAAWLASKGRFAEAAAARATARTAAGITEETPADLAIRTASPEEAAKENLDKTFAQVRTEQARAQQIEKTLKEQDDALGGQEGAPQPGASKQASEEATPGVQELGEGTRVADTTGTDDLLRDANEALRRVKAPELAELPLRADGKIEVPAPTKKLLDDAGLGRPFAVAAETPRDAVIFATTGRVVGSMDRASVQAFKDDVAAYAAEGVENVSARNPAGAFKIDNLGDPENVQPLIRGLIDGVAAKGSVSVEQMMAAAQKVSAEVGEDPTAILAFAEGIASNADQMYAAVAATRTMWARLSGNVDRHLAVDLDTLGDDAFQELAKDIRNAMAFSGSYAQVKTGLGRGLFAARLPDAESYLAKVGKVPDELVVTKGQGAEPMLPRTKEEVKDWLETWKAFDGDPAGRAKWMERKFQLPAPWLYLRTSVANFFTANLLSAPKTLALNVLAPPITGALRTIEKTAGGAMAALNPTLPAAQRRELLAVAAKTPTAYLQAFGDMQDALKFSLQALRRGEPILGGGGSIRDGGSQLGPISPRLIEAAGGSPQWQYSAGNVINLWPRALQKVNAGLDEFAKRISYFGEARASKLVEGSQKGLRGQQLNEYVREELTKMTDALGHAQSDTLLRSAERTTFTGDVGSDASFSRRIAAGVTEARKAFPELRFVLPIFNVPANALGETLRRVPFVNATFKEASRELAGELGPVAQAEAYGRFLSGTALLGTGLALSRMGLVTGGGPQDPRDRAVWLQTHQPYSIRVGDTWVDYSRVDILGALIAIPAGLYDRTVHQRQDKGWEHNLYGGIAILAEYMKDRAALSTLEDFLTFSSSPTSNPESFFERFIGTTVGNLAVPNFITALGRNPTDDVVRAKAGVWDYIKDKLPVLSQELDPVRNVLGEYVHKPQDSLLEGALPVTMSPVVSFKDDPELDEIGRLYEATGYAAGVSTPRQMMGGFFDPREVKLPEGGSLWNSIMRNRSTVTVDGMTLRESLADLFASADYETAIDADASNLTLSDGRLSRGALVSAVFEKYTKAAQAETARESPTASRWLAVVKAKRTDDGVLRTVEAREAVENPDLLESLGIDITAYESALQGQ